MTGRVLGIDPGEARVGVALSDELGMLASPLETIIVKKTDPVARIAGLAREHRASAIVVGMPRNMDGSFGPAAHRAQSLIHALRERVGCPVHAWDERLSTLEAGRALRECGRTARQARSVIDQAAARVILQSWLDAQATG
ncbi:MAG: Holliday junction resolvase RuvX [Terrimicrobiaceae bacterium]|nr:Holliday junction resolvase RuvX [Terrimicrobiaceae bacterium]